MGLSQAKKKELAEELYISDTMNAKQIALHIDISEVTLSKWKKEGRWEERKKELALRPLKLKELLINEATKVASGEVSNINADALSKLISAIDKLDKKVALPVIIDICKEIDNYVSKHDPQTAVIFTEWHSKFIRHIALTGR